MIIQRKPLQAIETIYNGYRFRSRLEARWAVFLDTLHVEYDYEPQGFYLDGACYLPDFWLPEPFGCWMEVKGKAPSREELEKAQMLARYDKRNVYIFWGSIEIPTEYHDEVNSGVVLFGVSGSAEAARWFGCTCGFRGVGCIHFADHHGESHVASTITPSLVTAFTAARQARFEHGETPPGRKMLY